MSEFPVDKAQLYAFFDKYKFSSALENTLNFQKLPLGLQENVFCPIALENSKDKNLSPNTLSLTKFYATKNHLFSAFNKIFLLDRNGIYQMTLKASQKPEVSESFRLFRGFSPSQKGEALSAALAFASSSKAFAVVSKDRNVVEAIDLEKGDSLFEVNLKSPSGFSDFSVQSSIVSGFPDPGNGVFLVASTSFRKKSSRLNNDEFALNVAKIKGGKIIAEKTVFSHSFPKFVGFLPKTDLLVVIFKETSETQSSGAFWGDFEQKTARDQLKIQIIQKEGEKFNSKPSEENKSFFWPNEETFSEISSSCVYFLDCFKSHESLLIASKLNFRNKPFLFKNIGVSDFLSIGFSNGPDALITRLEAVSPSEATFSHVDTFPALAQILKTRKDTKFSGFSSGDSRLALILEHCDFGFVFDNPRGKSVSAQRILQVNGERFWGITETRNGVVILSGGFIWIIPK